MAFEFEEEKEIESWLEPLTEDILGVGYRYQSHTNTHIFWKNYMHLQEQGFTEQMLVDYTLHWMHYAKIPFELAVSIAVFQLAKKRGLSKLNFSLFN